MIGFEGLEAGKLALHLTAFHQLTDALAANQDLPLALANTLPLIEEATQAERATLLSYAPLKLALEGEGFYLKVTREDVRHLVQHSHPLTLDELKAQLPEWWARNEAVLVKAQPEMVLPLVARGELAGMMVLGPRPDFTPFEEDAKSFLFLMGRQIALVMHYFRMVEDLRKTVEQLRKQKSEMGAMTFGVQEMGQLSSELAAIWSLDELPPAIAEGAVRNLAARRGVLWLFDYEKRQLEVLAAKGVELEVGKAFMLDKSPLSRVAIHGAPEMGEWESGHWGIEGQHMLAVPLKKNNEEVIGVLSVFDKEAREGVGTFNSHDEALLTTLATQAATMWVRLQYYDLATVDGLTRLFVRRHLEQRLNEEVRKALRFNKKLSLIMIDIDHFKKFNDTYGHKTGDNVLKLVAQQLKQTVRTGIDLPARYGGEELTVVVPEADREGAMQLAERIREAVQNTPLPGPNGETLHVTISLGVATLPMHGRTKEELFEKADIALYQAKRGGRNRCCFYSGDGAP